MPLVSVIIPCFNGAKHIGAAIDSALAQTIRDIEIIVIDDGSTDSSARVMQPYLGDKRVRYRYQMNRGLPGARNAGAQVARSDYLAFLDADDQLTPNAIELMLLHVLQSGSDWCLIDILKKTHTGDEVQRTEIPSGNIVHGILREDFIRRGMFFLRDSFFAVGMYDEEMKNREDWDINIRMFSKGFVYSYLPQPLYLYTWRPGSITGDRARILNYTERLLRKHHKRLADAGDRDVSKIYADLLWGLSRQRMYETSDLLGAVRCALQSLRYDFSVGRLLHPFAYQMRRLLFPRPVAQASNAVGDETVR